MKRALVRKDIQRLFQVEPQGGEFPVPPPMEWVNCADGVRPESHDFDGVNFVAKPVMSKQLEREALSMKRAAAFAALQEQQLSAAAENPGAPQAVKDYAVAREKLTQ